MSSSSNDHFKIENLYNVKGKIALVTGGGSGIGLMATQALAVNGAKVYIVGRTKEKLDRVVEAHGKDIAGSIIPITADITNKKSIRELVKEISSKESHLDILVNNAGISLNTTQTEAKTAEEMSKNLFEDDGEDFTTWSDTYTTNVSAVFFMSTAFLPLLQKASEHQKGYSGTLINITSISGIVRTAQHHFSYNASKGAAIHLTSMLATEIASNGLKIRVNSLAPGVFPSEMTADESDDKQKSSLPKDKFEEKVPARRPGKDEDMASGILFLATNQYTNGANVVIDGGYVVATGAGSA